MKKVIKLNESDIQRIVKRVLTEQERSRMDKISVVTSALNDYKRQKNMGNLGIELNLELEKIRSDKKLMNPDHLVNVYDFNKKELEEYVPYHFE